jgi:hypothetical protein
MKPLALLPTFLDRLDDPTFLRTFFARALWVLAVVAGVTLAFVFILNWKDAFSYEGEVLAGCIVYQLFFAVAAYTAVHILLLRAGNLREQEPGGMPAAAASGIILRALGEAWAAAGALLGLGTGLFVWIAERRSSTLQGKTDFLFPHLRAGEASFLGGGVLIARGLLYSLAALLLAYLLAELLQRLSRQVEAVSSPPGGPAATSSSTER